MERGGSREGKGWAKRKGRTIEGPREMSREGSREGIKGMAKGREGRGQRKGREWSKEWKDQGNGMTKERSREEKG